MLDKVFQNTKAQKRAALTVFITCGDPNLDFTCKLIKRAAQNGADIIELGVPFSDPMADGPTIQASSQRALASAITLPKIIAMAARLREEGITTPFVLFGYCNVFFKCGYEKVAKLSAQAGIDAWLLADLPMEESDEVLPILRKNGLELIPLASPVTPPERIEKISKSGGGFLYYITALGVTGVRDSLPKGFAERLQIVREHSHLSVAAGFGISSARIASDAAKCADAVVVGSKFVQLVHETFSTEGEDAALEKASLFIKELAKNLTQRLP